MEQKSMTDKRTPQLVLSLDADFEKDTWTVSPQDRNYRVAGGLYLMIPVRDQEDADRLQKSVAELRSLWPGE